MSVINKECVTKGCKTKIDRRATRCVPCYNKLRADRLTNRTCTCGAPKYRSAKRCRACAAKALEASKPGPQVKADRERAAAVADRASLKRRYEEALRTIDEQTRALRALDSLEAQGVQTFEIKANEGSATSESVPVLVASDWHIEERVKRSNVSGLNEHSLEIAKTRATRFFQGGLRLIRLLQQDVRITTAVVALLGDFINNDIHEEFPENNELAPMLAISEVESWLASGVEFLLNNSKLKLTLPCHSGNHGRTTRTTRFASESGHSLEWLMYRHLAAYFRNESRVNFIIPDGPHSYLDIYGQTLRFHHGHMIKYQGGVGGIFIPAFKAIAQWNKARRADIDVFGHFHQVKDGGNFLCNGSNIGYNAFALSIKADYEVPKQLLFLMDKKRGRTCTWPILTGNVK